MTEIVKWEYLSNTFFLGKLPSSEDLDEFGAAGWELVSMIAASGGRCHCVFKRPKIFPVEVRDDE